MQSYVKTGENFSRPNLQQCETLIPDVINKPILRAKSEYKILSRKIRVQMQIYKYLSLRRITLASLPPYDSLAEVT